jgi:hypothetical protein
VVGAVAAAPGTSPEVGGSSGGLAADEGEVVGG